MAEPVIEVSEHWVTTTFRRPVAEAGTKSGPSRDQASNSISDSRLHYHGQPSGDANGQVGDQVRPKEALSSHQVEILRNSLSGQPILELMALSGKRNRTKFRNQVLRPLLEEGLLEMTVPDKPRSSKQKYRVTARGRDLLAELDSRPD